MMRRVINLARRDDRGGGGSLVRIRSKRTRRRSYAVLRRDPEDYRARATHVDLAWLGSPTGSSASLSHLENETWSRFLGWNLAMAFMVWRIMHWKCEPTFTED